MIPNAASTPSASGPSASIEASSGYLARLRAAGIEPGDGPELQLAKSLLMLATGLVVAAMMVWVAIYHLLGLQFSSTLPFAFQLLLVGNMLAYIGTRRFGFFRVTQLGLFLFLPFFAHWTAGSVVASSGVILWSVLAPVGAMLSGGVRQSLGWFVAWVVLTAAAGVADFHFAAAPGVPLRISMVFFSLNFIAVVSLVYALLFFAVQQKIRIQERLEQSRRRMAITQDATDKLFGSFLM